jgi:uncharacterized protein YbjT (DUF2867 family)
MILMTGTTGRAGSLIVRELSRRGIRARALFRTREGANRFGELPHIEPVVGDMAREPTLGQALAGVSRVLMISSPGPAMFDTQCGFIESAKSAGVRHIVKFGGRESGLDFDARRFRSTRAHEAIERYLESSGLAWTHLRPSQFMQIYFQEAPTIRASGELCLPMGSAPLAPVDLEDVAKVAASLVTEDGHEGMAYDMSGPEALDMQAIAERLTRALRKSVRYVDVAPEVKRRAWLQAGLDEERADALGELFAERRRQTSARITLETHRRFDLRPTTFAEFAAREAVRLGGGA